MTNFGNSGSAQQDSGFLAYFHKLPEKDETTMRFFGRNDFYSVYGSDALFAAQEVFKSTNNVKKIGSGDGKTEALNLNRKQFETLVRDLLLVQQYRVEIYTGRGSDWSLEYKGSPGNLAQVEELIPGLSGATGGVVMAVKSKKDGDRRTLGISAVSLDDDTFQVCELEDDDAYTQLEGIVVQLAPKEVLLPDSGDYRNITQVVKRAGVMVVPRKTAQFSLDGLSDDLNRLLQWKAGQAENSLSLEEMEKKLACGALNATIGYLELLKDESNTGQFSLATLHPEQFVHVDGSAAKALGLLNGPGSLLSHLDRCRTGPGKRLLAQWVKQPLRDFSKINNRLNLVEILVNDAEMRARVSDDHLRRFPDLQLLARRLQRKTSTMQDCYKVFLAVERISPLLETLKVAEQSAIIQDELIKPLEERLSEMEKFQEMVTSTLDMDSVERGEFLVKSSFSDELGDLGSQRDQLLPKMEKELKKTSVDLGLEPGKTIKLEHATHLGYFFRTTNKKEDRTIRNNRDLKIIDGNKGSIRFQSTALGQLSSQYVQIQKEYDECQKSIVEEIVSIAAGYAPSIFSLSQILAKLDVVTSFAVVASNAPVPYIRPIFSAAEPGNGHLRFIQARHPILESIDSVAFIPNDVEMSHNAKTFQIITGPNMGGKSTFLRTIGSCAVLAHIGCFVPCDKAELTVLNTILARVGASDCQIAGVSTFMNEMVETCAILKRASADSLVLIDELGRGTSTYEGCGLAWSIASELAGKIRAFCLFATHFQELTVLEKEIGTVTNRHVAAVASEAGLTLLYQLQDGPTDRSFGIEVARMAKLPLKIIQTATEKLLELEQKQGLGISGVNFTAEEIESGEKIVKKFLEDLKTQGVEKMEELRKELYEKKHPYIQAILL